MKRIFLVGTPRSGTTLLQGLVAAHPGVASFTESHLFSRHFSRRLRGRVLLVRPGLRARGAAFLRENGIDPASRRELLERLPADGSLLPWRSRAAARACIDLLDSTAAETGADTWLEKTPLHLRQLDVIEAAVPDGEVRVLHIVRRGPDVVASLHAASGEWGEGYSLDRCIRRWNRDLEVVVARLRAGRRDVVVLYEELTTSPGPVLEGLFARLDLEPDRAVLERYPATVGAVTVEEERWKESATGSIRPRSTFEERLGPRERERVLRELRTELYDEVRTHAHGMS